MSSQTKILLAACGVCAVAFFCLGSSFFAEHYAQVQVRPVQISRHAPAMNLQGRPHVTRQTIGARPEAKLHALPEAILEPLASTPAFFVSDASEGTWIAVAAIAISFLTAYFSAQKKADPAPVRTAEAVRVEELSLTKRTGEIRIDQVAQAVKEEQAQRKNLTPKEVILQLQQGNARFWSGTPERPELQAIERRALIVGQAPTVCVISCSDSRVPVEILFDQGLGSIFVVRVAGNILDSTATGSVEFSVKYLGVKVVLVMGHEGCGAVKGALTMSADDIEAQPIYLQSVLRSIKTNLNISQLRRIRDSRAQDREAIVVNATTQVKKLQANPLIAERVARGELLVCGAFYEITSGIVDFFTLDKNGLVTDL